MVRAVGINAEPFLHPLFSDHGVVVGRDHRMGARMDVGIECESLSMNLFDTVWKFHN